MICPLMSRNIVKTERVKYSEYPRHEQDEVYFRPVNCLKEECALWVKEYDSLPQYFFPSSKGQERIIECKCGLIK